MSLRLAGGAATGAALLLGVVGCSAQAGAGDSAPATPNSGDLTVAAYLQYPPYRYLDENDEPAGLEIELAKDIAAKLGVGITFENVEFNAIIPAVSSGRYDFALGQFLSLPDRQQQVDIMEWTNITTSLVVPKGNPDGLAPDDLCGTTLASVTGGTEIEVQNAISESCVADGKEPIEQVVLGDTAPAVQAVLGGRAQGMMLDPGVATYLSQQNGDSLEVLPGLVPGYDLAPAGWIFANNDTALESTVSTAIDELISEGTWGELLDEYGLSANAIVPPTVDGKPVAQ